MSEYTTGEAAKLCGVTVRTMQYYDKCGLLSPSRLTDGGRLLYSDADLDAMRRIVFLKSLGLSLDEIRNVLESDEAEKVLFLLLCQQEEILKNRMNELKAAQGKIALIKQSLSLSGDTILNLNFDMELLMNNQKKRKNILMLTLILGAPLTLLQDGIIIYWIISGNWRLCLPLLLAALVVAVPFAVIMLRRYYALSEYICPECKERFRPGFKEFFFAGHTPKTRKLTCPHCGNKKYCLEVAASDEET